VADRFDPKKRSEIMSNVRNKGTWPEKKVRSILHRMGYRFSLRRKDLPGRPDIVLPKYDTVVFVHGCFWHGHEGCRRAARPETNSRFWKDKIEGNIKRDRENNTKLEELGWYVITIWQCELKDEGAVREKLSQLLRGVAVA